MTLELSRGSKVRDPRCALAVHERSVFAPLAPSRRPDATERESPCRPNQPGSKAFTVAQAMKIAIRAQHGLLRHVFRFRRIAQHSQRNAVGQRRTVSQTLLELSFERSVLAHRATRKTGCQRIHLGPTMPDAGKRVSVHLFWREETD